MDKFLEWSKECDVTPGGNFLYSVASHEFEKEYSVDFNKHVIARDGNLLEYHVVMS
jgi:hypothetical protein